MALNLLKKLVGKTFSTNRCEALVAFTILYRHYKQLLTKKRFEAKRDLWDHAIHTIGQDTDVLLLEFGVWKGESIRYFSSQFRNPNARFLGFDSFEGLPEDWYTNPKGHFSTHGAIPEIADSRVQFVKGWFQQTFTAGLKQAHAAAPSPKTVLIHFDADLYSSTLFLLTALYGEFDEYYFVFDEFMTHECRALYNFQQAYGIKVEFFSYRNGEVPFPEQVFGKITKH